ncbi:MAG: hypothetical protein HC828_18475 [Blastochloris sp.]|nr:hypothetical protein [Blastochloris sp.]
MRHKLTHSTIQQVRFPDDWFPFGGCGIYRPAAAAVHIFGDDAPTWQGAMLIYLWRRFGLPVNAWDGEKDLVNYWLTTPDPAILLCADPGVCPWTSFGFGLCPDLYADVDAAWLQWKQAEQATPWSQHVLAQRIDYAITAAMCELQRPVLINSNALTIAGPLVDTAPESRWDFASVSPLAGVGCTCGCRMSAGEAE